MGALRTFIPLVLLAALLPFGCNNAVPPQPPVGSLPPDATSPSGSPDATHGNGSSASPSASVAPSTSIPVQTAILRGMVYDDDGKIVEGATVRVRSLNPSRPFDTTVQVFAGNYAVNDVPIETQLEISAIKPGWTTRTRVDALRSNRTNIQNRNVFNFGGNYDDIDPAGLSYFLSARPEIERIEPSDDASMIASDKMSFKLVMSEPLDVLNQRRLASAFLIVPNNREALADTGTLPQETATDTASATASELVGLFAGATPATTSAYRYRQNAGYLNGYEVSTFTWDADGRTATFSLQAPVKTDENDEAEYAFLLVQADDDPIVDAEKLPLGMDDTGEFGGTKAGDVIRNAIREPEVSLERGQTDDPEERWAQSHLSYTTFTVAPDTTAPSLQSVLARRNYDEGRGLAVDRIEITFSEPMIAYPNISSRHLLSLNNYIITAAATQKEIDERELKSDGTAADVEPGDSADVAREAFSGARGAAIGENGSLATAAGGVYSIAISVKDPRVVVLQMPAGYLPLDANFIKVFVGSDNNSGQASGGIVADPAGNPVAATNVSGPIN